MVNRNSGERVKRRRGGLDHMESTKNKLDLSREHRERYPRVALGVFVANPVTAAQ